MGLVSAAYFDASGKQEGFSCITVAGAVSPVKKWVRFEKHWTQALKDEGVNEFHATDFASSKGEYKAWKDDKMRRSMFINRLIKVIRDNVNKLFLVTVETNAWREVNKEFLLEETFYSAYALAGFSVASQAKRWAIRKRLRPATFKIFFEDGDEGWNGLKHLCQLHCGIEPLRLPKREGVPFQVGDFLAWKTRITATNAIGGAKSLKDTDGQIEVYRVVRELMSLDHILVRPVRNCIFSPDALRRTCINSKVPKRGNP